MTMMLPSVDEIAAIAGPVLARHDVPGAGIALVLDGGARVVPLGRREQGGAAVTADTRFQLASLTKAYTAAVIATLVDRGELSWDDPVRRYLPEFALYDERLSQLATLRDLLSMRLGLKPEGVLYWGRNQELGVETILARLPHVEPVAGFREKFTYYNPAYTLLTEVVARATGMTYAGYLNDALLAPAGLADTFVQEGRIDDPVHPHAVPHVLLDEGVRPLGELRCGGRIGESCTYASPRDAARWLSLHLNSGQIEGRRVVSAAAMAEMHRPHVLAGMPRALGHDFIAYGMGWQCRDGAQGMLLAHEGGEFGVSTYIVMNPALRAGVAVYLNANVPAASRAIGHLLLDRLTGAPAQDWAGRFAAMADQERNAMADAIGRMFAPGSGDDLPLDVIAGRYHHPVNGEALVSGTADRLDFTVLDGRIYDAALTPLGGGVYAGTCLYPGTQSLARRLNRIRFRRIDGRVCLETPGLGRMEKR